MKYLWRALRETIKSLYIFPELNHLAVVSQGHQMSTSHSPDFIYSFQRTNNIQADMGIGIWKEIKEWFVRNNYGRAYQITYSEENGKYVIEANSGFVVLKDFELKNLIWEKTGKQVEIKIENGQITILSNLDTIKIYHRLKEHYNQILINCLGKDIKEQQLILFGEDFQYAIPLDDKIEKSESYIRSLSDNPTIDEIRDICKQIFFGILEYAYPTKDIFGVDTYLYAETLELSVVFEEYLADLKQLYPKKTTKEIEHLRELFFNAEKYWEFNLGRFGREQKLPIQRETKQIVVKYLLICEAPPESGEYFYKSTDGYLFKQVWYTFFVNDVPDNQDDAYLALLKKGFLLVDTLPYSLKYKSKDRKKPEYETLVKSYLPVWLAKLNRIRISPNVKIAFGFKLNSESVLRACNYQLTLNGVKFELDSSNIAASGSGLPTSDRLSTIFGTINSKDRCN